MRKQRDQAGFGIVEVVIILVVLALIGVGGWYVWKVNQKSPVSNDNSSTGNTIVNHGQTVALASNHVQLTLPVDWSVSGSHLTGDQCMHTLSSQVTCLDQITVSPNAIEKINGVPTYAATVAVYKHDDTTSAKDWWQKDYDGSDDTGAVDGGAVVDSSTAAIAGHDGYYFKSQSANSSTVWYIVAEQNYVLVLNAVVNQPASATTAAQDYSQYLPAIKAFVESVTIQ